MRSRIEQLRALVSAAKTVPVVPSWKVVPVRDVAAECRLSCPLAIGGLVAEGLTLVAAAPQYLPQQDVVLQLVSVWPASASRYHLTRIEWRPRKQHRNDGRAPPHLRFREIRGSQIHPFELNCRYGVDALSPSENLPVAEPLALEPQSYWEFLDLAGTLLNIEALAQIGEPPWAPRLDLTR
jgi:hypothetical protein